MNIIEYAISKLSRTDKIGDFLQDCHPSRLKSTSLILRILKVLCLLVPFRVNVFVPGIFKVPIEVIVIDGELKTDIIHDVWGSRPACVVHAADRRVMDFRRRPGPDEPDAQVIEDGPDHQWVFDEADDLHGPLTFRVYQSWVSLHQEGKCRPLKVPPNDLLRYREAAFCPFKRQKPWFFFRG
jgi:hypothetical protein